MDCIRNIYEQYGADHIEVDVEYLVKAHFPGKPNEDYIDQSLMQEGLIPVSSELIETNSWNRFQKISGKFVTNRDRYYRARQVMLVLGFSSALWVSAAYQTNNGRLSPYHAGLSMGMGAVAGFFWSLNNESANITSPGVRGASMMYTISTFALCGLLFSISYQLNLRLY